MTDTSASTYRRRTRVRAPLEDVWEFHSTPDGLEALTPEFLDMEVTSVVGPDGEPDPDVLEAGSRLEISVRPLGVGPRTRWVSVIDRRSERDGAASFRDVMIEGPFPEWRHTHSFFADGEETIVVDHVEYRLPGGRLGGAATPFGRLGLEGMFRYRHRRTKALLET